MNSQSNRKYSIYAVAIVFSLIACVLLLVSAKKGAEAQSFESKIYKPTKDFSFIKRFICISDLLGAEQWSKLSGRSFDNEGIALTNGKKHPVNICHYALFCFDEYRATGDSFYKEAFLKNARVMIDPLFYHRTDVDKVAYPYEINFHDLKPPWYSALAQSEAISVLIRYYSLTKEDSVLNTIIELKNFMVAPQEDNCGTMSVTPEGHEWYEEYPNSKQERQVLNGFFLSIVALHEFCNLFPNDTTTYRLYQNTIETAKQSFKFYDTGSWLKYNRGDQRQVNNGYMKWQTLELKFLHQLTGDDYFKHLMMLVATYCYNKSYVTPGSKLQDYDFSVPMVENSQGKLVFEGKRTAIDLRSENPKVNVNCPLRLNEIPKLYDNNLNSFIQLCQSDSTFKDKHEIEFNFKEVKKISNIRLDYIGLDALTKPDVEILFKDSTDGSKRYKSIKYTYTDINIKYANYFFDDVSASSVIIKIEKLKNEKIKTIRLSEVTMTQPPQMVKSDFWHYTSKAMKADSGKMEFSFDSKNMKENVIFYRTAENISMMNKSKYNPLKATASNKVIINNFNPSKNPDLYQFLIVCEPANNDAEVSNISFKKIQ